MLSDPCAAPGRRRLRTLQSACLYLHVALQSVTMATPALAWEGEAAASDLDPFIAPSGLWLGLRGGLSRAGHERQRSYAVLELTVGFDAHPGAAPSGLSSAGVTREPASALAQSPGSAGSGREPERLSAPSHPPPTPSEARTPSLARCTDGQPCGDPLSLGVSPALARAVVASALRVLGSGAELRRLDSMATRSRASASLPEVRLGAGTSRDESLRLTPTLADPGRFTQDGGRDLWFEARLAWRLDGALFSKEEIAIERLKAEHRQERARVIREVLDALLDWQRAGVVLRTEHLLPEEREAALVKEIGAVARLDVATDGWFSRYLERRRGAAAASRGP